MKPPLAILCRLNLLFLVFISISSWPSQPSAWSADLNHFSPAGHILCDEVDVQELNHFHDDQGRPVFDQIIFYDWSTTDRRYQIRDWRLLKNPNQVPMRRTSDGDYIAVWSDFKSRDVMRETSSKLFRETWTQFDPELVERDFLPESKRKRLAEVLPRRPSEK